MGTNSARATTTNELLPPLHASAEGLADQPACRFAPPPDDVARAHLVIQRSPRPVGPYNVVLDGFTNPHAANGGHSSYRPILIETNAGTTLRIDLDNRLPQADAAHPLLTTTNLHTHGLIVSPQPFDPRHPCPGDSVYQSVPPPAASGQGSLRSYRIDIPDRIPAAFFGLGKPGDTVAHPSGLFWFHAHLHTVAKAQVTAGMAGLISIGDPMTHLRVDREDSQGNAQVDEPATRALRAQTDVRYLALRDIQLDVAACAAPGPNCDRTMTLPDHQGAATAKVSVTDPGAYDPALCRPGRTDAKGHKLLAPYEKPDTGFCAGFPDAGTNRVWMFTVNGQLFPTITVTPNRNHLWRIANLSASRIYVLDLAERQARDRDAAEHELCVISMDGVVAGSNGARTCGGQPGGSRYASVGFTVKRLLLMPGSRAEIFVPNDNRGQDEANFVLRTLAMNAGNSDPNSQGDVWPQADLAHVVMAPQPKAGPEPRMRLRADLVRTQAGPGRAEAGGAEAPVNEVDAQALESAHPGCVILPGGPVASRRQIVFDEIEASGTPGFDPGLPYDGFALGSRIVSGPIGGGDMDLKAGLRPQPYVTPHVTAGRHGMAMDALPIGLPTGPRVCPVLHRGEVWELANWTTEAHNFHIHQGKFRLAMAGDPGLPADFSTPVIGESPEKSPIMGFLSAVADPARDVQAWHDTLPVPPRIQVDTPDALGRKYKPGRVFVFIPFEAEQQIGSFAFHCHILEHEDKGMMADVEVIRPAHHM
ncbi:MAG: multicopper oxidase domain-containing protein [Rhodopila sp.]